MDTIEYVGHVAVLSPVYYSWTCDCCGASNVSDGPDEKGTVDCAYCEAISLVVSGDVCDEEFS